jgi:hypothetical protein
MGQKDNILKLPARLVEELGGQGIYVSSSSRIIANAFYRCTFWG